MLILTRYAGEKIRLGSQEEVEAGGGIEVTVIRTRGGQVTLGFDAPRDVYILRSELGPLTVAGLRDE